MLLRDNKFVISCAARTGSTMLTSLLRAHPDIVSHGEVFVPDALGHIDGRYQALRRADPTAEARLLDYAWSQPERFIYDVLFDLQGRRVAGFKFKTDEAFQPRWRPIADALASDLSIKIVYLRRRNLLEQYISHQVVLRQTGLTFIQDAAERPVVQPFAVDPGHLEAYLSDVLGREEASRRLYEGHPTFEISYEELLAPDGEALAALQRFLGVAPRPLRPTTQRILLSPLDLVLNREEVLALLAARGLPGGVMAAPPLSPAPHQPAPVRTVGLAWWQEEIERPRVRALFDSADLPASHRLLLHRLAPPAGAASFLLLGSLEPGLLDDVVLHCPPSLALQVLEPDPQRRPAPGPGADWSRIVWLDDLASPTAAQPPLAGALCHHVAARHPNARSLLAGVVERLAPGAPLLIVEREPLHLMPGAGRLAGLLAALWPLLPRHLGFDHGTGLWARDAGDFWGLAEPRPEPPAASLLALLQAQLACEVFLPTFSLADPLLGRRFGPNVTRRWPPDVDWLRFLQHLTDRGYDDGSLWPGAFAARYRKGPAGGPPRCWRDWSPAHFLAAASA